MPSYNKVILIGHLTRDPEFKEVGQGLCVFGLAINEKWKDKEGNPHEKVSFVDCKAWGKTGEFIREYFTKGKAILVEGKLEMESWETAEGAKRSKLVVVVDRSTFVGSKGDKGDGPEAPADGDIPF